MLPILKKVLEPKNNISQVTCLLAQVLKLKITASTLTYEIDEHPHRNSLLSISDVLSRYGVSNLALAVKAEHLPSLPFPFVASIKSSEQNINLFSVVKEIIDEEVVFYDFEKYKWRRLPLNKFKDKFTGTILVIDRETEAPIIETNYNKKLQLEKREWLMKRTAVLSIPIILILAFFFVFFKQGTSVFLPISFLILSLLGTVAGILLVFVELDQHAPLSQQICGGGEKKNCSSILQSKASKIAGIKWSSIGLAYFLGQLLFSVIAGLSTFSTLVVLGWLSLVSLPYIFFSIFYQWKIAKQWCRLCLWTQLLLSLQFFITLAGGWHNLIPTEFINPYWFLAVTMALTFSLLSVIIIRSMLEKSQEEKKYKTELQHFKHNPQIFEALLSKQKMIPEPPDHLGISLGSSGAKYKIIKVCNPYCGPCAKAHTLLEMWLKESDDIQLQIIFTATNDDRDIKAPPVKHLMAIAQKGDQLLTKQALDDWYSAEQKNYELFKEKYPLSASPGRQCELEQQAEKLSAMTHWCQQTGIQFTPTFFLSLPTPNKNNKFYQLPDLYTISDLKYFVTD